MTLARQVDLEETGNGTNAGASSHTVREDDHPTSGTPDRQQHSNGGTQVYSMLETPSRYIVRNEVYNTKGELDESAYDTSK